MLTTQGLCPRFSWPAFAWLAFYLSGPLQAQPALPSALTASVAASTPSFRQALDAAWALDANAKTLRFKQAELAARQKAATSWIAGDPSITLAHRTDRLNANGGLREYEAEVSAPLWNRNAQAATQQAIRFQEQSLAPAAQLAKSKLSLALLGLAAEHALSDLEHTLALRKLAESELLAKDTERRLRAGDVARLDNLQAQSAVLQAKNQAAAALLSKQRLQAQWQALTGLAAISPLPAPSSPSTAKPDMEQHPATLAARAQMQANAAKLRLAEADSRDPMELGVGLTRERSALGATPSSNLRIALRIPLGSDNRNQPRIAAARTEVELAQAEIDAALRMAQQDTTAASAALQHAQTSQQAALERAALAAQMQALVAQAYRLGERDLPARLRADNEKYEAELTALRSQLELRRAAAHLELTLGQLP